MGVPAGCVGTYTTFVVRVPLHSGGSLPRARVVRGRAAGETAELAWVPVSQVQGADRDLHPSFADAWPALRRPSRRRPDEGIRRQPRVNWNPAGLAGREDRALLLASPGPAG
jgi:hypothetical protein